MMNLERQNRSLVWQFDFCRAFACEVPRSFFLEFHTRRGTSASPTFSNRFLGSGHFLKLPSEQ